MTSSIIQLHAAPEEFAAYIGDIPKTFDLNTVLLRFRPKFSSEEIADPLALASVMDLRDGQEVVLLMRSLDLTAANQLQLHDRNPDCISFKFLIFSKACSMEAQLRDLPL